jgi:predicted nucleic acid-binding protein
LILLDSGGLFAALNRAEPAYDAARSSLEREPGPHVLSPFVLAELDYLIATRGRPETELTVLEDVARGAYLLAPFDAADVGAAIDVIERYRDQSIGLADASIVVLAERYGTSRVLTLDERQFRMLRTRSGKHFTLLPADA